jgi:5'(3')-deoxyribonucleotidase
MESLQKDRDDRFDHIIFFDMDNVLVDFKSGLDRVSPEIKAEYDDDGTGKPHYDDIPGLFSLMDPMPGAIEAVKALAALGKYELYILSTAPWGNPSAWTDKAKWVQKHFDSDRPDGVFYKRLILSHHKNMCVQPNAWLIDDRKAHGSECFGEHFIHFGSEKFPDWESVVAFFTGLK